MKRINIWFMNKDGKTFWKEHGKSSWSADCGGLLDALWGNDFSIRKCKDENETQCKWDDVEDKKGVKKNE